MRPGRARLMIKPGADRVVEVRGFYQNRDFTLDAGFNWSGVSRAKRLIGPPCLRASVNDRAGNTVKTTGPLGTNVGSV